MTVKLYKPKEAAEVLRVSLATVKRRIADGSLPATVDLGVPGRSRKRITEEALNEYIQERTDVA